MRVNEWSAHRPLRHDGHGLVRGIVHHGQVLDHPPFGGAIEHEVHRPDVIGRLRTPQGLPIGHRHLLAPPPLHLEVGFGIQPFHPLVVDPLSGLAQLQVNHAGAVAAMPLGQGNDLLPQGLVTIRRRLVAEGTGAHADDLQGMSLAQTAS